jgi:hypothetical protein
MSIISPAPQPVRPAGTPHRPSSLGYWIGGALIAVACIGAAVWAVLAFAGYTNQVNSFQRMTVPGTASVHVTQATTRVLYYESTGAAPSLGQLGIHVTGPAGNPVTVTPYPGNLRYDVPPLNPTRAGKAIASFDATTPVTTPSAPAPPPVPEGRSPSAATSCGMLHRTSPASSQSSWSASAPGSR